MNDATLNDATPSADAVTPSADAVARRVDELLGAMTLQEKAGQVTQYFHFGAFDGAMEGSVAVPGALQQPGAPRQADEAEAALARGGVGSVLFVNSAAETNRLQRLAIEGNRLGIPVLFGYDVIHGLRTVFPVPLALAASWDPDLIERSQQVAAREARAIGVRWTFAPMVDIARDPRWGRIVEGAGEDPFLGAAVAAAHVRGFQGGQAGARDGVIAGPKHFAGYGAALGGRDYDEVNLSDYELWNVYFPPFRAALEAGAGYVMTAYMTLNGVPATGNPWLFREVLRDIWGFEGFVVSDADAVRSLVTHGFAADHTDAAVRGMSAGVDLEMAMSDPAYANLPAAVAAELVTEEELDAAVRRILEAKIRIGLFEQPFVDEALAEEILADPAHREAAQTAAERSAVLLRNDADLLPLDVESLGSVAVVGPLADSPRDTLGPWTSVHDVHETVTVLQGLRDRAGEGVRVEYAPGLRPTQRLFGSIFDIQPDNVPADPPGFHDEAEFLCAVELARASDVAVVVLGEWQNQAGEMASRSSLAFPGRQQELLEAVVATGTPVVLLVMSARPLDLRWAVEHVPAIVDIWYPGTRGGAAVAALLFGDVSPGGKLPLSWPRSVGQVPLVYSRTNSHDPGRQPQRYWDEESTPLFPFGYGLSYASFAYDELAVDRSSITVSDQVTVSVRVTNTSDRDGDEVVQLYLGQRHGGAARPVRELKGFTRVHLGAGESRTITFALGPEHLRYWNPVRRDWVIDPSPRDVWVGGDSTAQLHTSFDVVA